MERPDLLQLRQLALQCLHARSLLWFRLRLLKLANLRGDRVAPRELLEDAAEVRTLLRGDLRGGRVGRCGAVSDSEDAIRARHAQRLVDGNSAAIYLVRGQLRHEVAGHLAQRVAL